MAARIFGYISPKSKEKKAVGGLLTGSFSRVFSENFLNEGGIDRVLTENDIIWYWQLLRSLLNIWRLRNSTKYRVIVSFLSLLTPKEGEL